MTPEATLNLEKSYMMPRTRLKGSSADANSQA